MEIARAEGNESDLLNYLSQLRQSAPTSAWFQPALISAGNMYLLKKDYDHAIDYYREAHERFPEGSRAAYAHWKAAWLTYRQGRTEEAKKEFTQHVRSYPASPEIAAAIYWRGRIAEDENELPLARAWYAKVAERYRNYYYGHLAAERLAKIGVSPTAHDPLLDTIAPLAPLSAAAALTSIPADTLRVEKSKLLENAGMADFAIKELQASDGGKGANWATLEIARIYRDGGQYHRALRFMKSAVPSYFAIDISALPRPYWDYLFPRPYWTRGSPLRHGKPTGSFPGRGPHTAGVGVQSGRGFAGERLWPDAIAARLPAEKPPKSCACAVSERRRCWFRTSTCSSERAISARWSNTTTARWSTRWPPITPAPTASKTG